MKLSNCPICGHTPIIDKESLDRGNGHGYPGNYEYKVSCSNKGNCPLSRDIPMFSYTDIYCLPHEAVANLYAIWNKEAEKIDELIKHRND